MQDRKTEMAELRTVLSTETRLNLNNELAYQALAQCCDFFETQLESISELQYQEEYDAFVFVMAFIKSYPSAGRDVRLPFAAFISKLTARPLDASSIYAILIDWGCYLQKEYDSYWYLLTKASPGIMALIKKQLDAYSPSYGSRLETRKKLHQESYIWYVGRAQEIQKEIKETKLVLKLSPLFFLVPFSLCVAATCYVASKNITKGEIFATFASSFIASIPIINFVSAILLGIFMHVTLKENREQLQKQPWKGDLIVAKPRMGNESPLNQFRRQLKNDQRYSKDYFVQGKSRGARVKNVESAMDYRDKEQALRHEFYLQQWQASRSNQTKTSETKDSKDAVAGVTDFFRDLNQSKSRSKVIKHEVWKMYEDPKYRPLSLPSPRAG